MLLLVDNYDSFTFNLLHALESLGESVRVVRNDAIDLAGIEALAPEMLILSPGPGRPEQAGITPDAIRASLDKRPILGVCLGHQALGWVLGARVISARRLVHGKAEPIAHDDHGPFAGLPQPMRVARYHSLALDGASLPPELEVIARASDGEIMAIAHKTRPAAGVQFHPESFLTPDGPALLAGFLRWARSFR